MRERALASESRGLIGYPPERKEKGVKKLIIELLKIAVFVAFAVSVMIGVQHVLPSPPQKILVCIEDVNGEHDCTEYKRGEGR
jgi:hypothetical protein